MLYSYELQTQLIISNKLNLISDEMIESILNEISEIQKMTYTFKNTLQKQMEKV
ncbi:MAG TPA: four helix bundle protein [Bacteroidia bacterium]